VCVTEYDFLVGCEWLRRRGAIIAFESDKTVVKIADGAWVSECLSSTEQGPVAAAVVSPALINSLEQAPSVGDLLCV
jgi:hypothetical protein